MFVHTVFFWLKKGMSEEEIASFRKGLESLVHIKSVEHGHFGTPAATDRPIIDRSYDYGLTIINKDFDAQTEYQVDPVHDRFRDGFGKYFEKVVIYDYD